MIESSHNCFSSRKIRMNSRIWFFVATFVVLLLVVGCAVSERRRKRYISFPKGTTLSCQICLTYQMGITPGSIFTEAINWGINYPLEIKQEMMEMSMSKTSEERMLRRERRSLFNKIENMFYHMGYDGRDCILRSLCEFSSHFDPSDRTMEKELLKVFFEYASEALTEYETKDDRIYHNAQRIGEEMGSGFCQKSYPKCNFSLLHILTGKHSVENLIRYMRK